MRSEFRRLLQANIDEKLKNVPKQRSVDPPSGGWLKAIRVALAVPARYPASKLGLTTQAVEQLERGEAAGAITLKNLRRAADALDCDVVYAVVPRAGSLSAMLSKQADKRARTTISAVAHSMRLENQGTDSEEQAAELARKFVADPKPSLWVTE